MARSNHKQVRILDGRMFSVFGHASTLSGTLTSSPLTPDAGNHRNFIDNEDFNSFVRYTNNNATMTMQISPLNNSFGGQGDLNFRPFITRLIIQNSSDTANSGHTVGDVTIKTIDLNNQEIQSISKSLGTVQTQVIFDFAENGINYTEVDSIKVILSNFQSGTFARVNSIKIFGGDLSEDYDFEFNDSVLSTKAWNSSRYDGRQLKGTLLNKYNSSNDTSYGKTPVLQKYTRNIYIGNTILSGDPGAEDNENLLSFPQHSFITTRKYITINSDDSISEYELENPDPNSLTFIRGYLRRFRQDFAEHSNMRVLLLDDTVSSNLDPSYKIYSNIGLLKKVVTFRPVAGNVLGINGTVASQTSSYGIFALRNDVTKVPSDGFGRIYISSHFPPEGATREDGIEEERFNTGMTVGINSLTELEKVYTGSFFGGSYTIGIQPVSKFQEVSYVSAVSNFVPSNKIREFFKGIETYQGQGDLKEAKRYFISLCESGSDTPLQLGRTGSISGSEDFYFDTDPFTNKDLELGDFSTVEFNDAGSQQQNLYTNGNSLFGFGGDNSYANSGYLQSYIRVKDKLRQNYMSNDVIAHTKTATSNDRFFGNNGDAQYFNTSSFHYSGSSAAFPNLFATGSVIVSRADITIPSMLVPLSKTEQLPDGVGDKPFILIPQNLHPFIKDNLTHFLMKAGLDTGDRKVLPEIKEKYRNLP